MINTGDGARARDDEASRDRILANLEGRSPRTGTTARGRKRMAVWSFALVGIGAAAAASYWYVGSNAVPTVQTAAVQTPGAPKSVSVASNGAEAPAVAAGAVTVAANAPAAAGAMAAPTALIENMNPAPAPASASSSAAAPVSATPAAATPAVAAAAPAQAAATEKAEPKKTAAVAAAKPGAAHAKPAGGKSASKTVVASSGDRKPAKKTGQADNDVDLIEALIVHTMQNGSDGKTPTK